MTLQDAYKRALVTGASSGIGAEVAKLLCSSNIAVLAVARDEKRLQQIKEELPIEKQKYFTSVAGDLRKKSDIEAILDTCKNQGAIDLLINNAAVGYSLEFEKQSDQQIEDVIHTNLLGHMFLTRGLLNLRKKDAPLHIVFVTSLAGKIGFSDLSVYCASKFGLEGLCEALRIDYQGSPIAFTVLRPGITDTRFFDKAGMQAFYSSVKGTKALHSPTRVAEELLKKLSKKPAFIIVGNDKYFLKLLPFIPFHFRFKVINILNKL